MCASWTPVFLIVSFLWVGNMEHVSRQGLVVCSSQVLCGSPQMRAPYQQLSIAAVALWGSSCSCFPPLFCPIGAVSPSGLPNSSVSTRAWLCSFSHLIPHNKEACRKLFIFSGLQYCCFKVQLLFFTE